MRRSLVDRRCICGVIGCGHARTEVAITDASTRWHGDGGDFLFPTESYRRWIAAAADDHGWEDENRRVERLVSEVLVGTRLSDGKRFRWASARIAPRTIRLSFEDDGAQVLLDVEWDGDRAETALPSARSLRLDGRA